MKAYIRPLRVEHMEDIVNLQLEESLAKGSVLPTNEEELTALCRHAVESVQGFPENDNPTTAYQVQELVKDYRSILSK